MADRLYRRPADGAFTWAGRDTHLRERSHDYAMPGIWDFAKENGWVLSVHRATGSALRQVRDWSIARKLKTTQLRLGRYPRLNGLGHIRIGRQFSAADGFWVDAITNFQGAAYTPQIIIGQNVNVSNNVHLACTNRLLIEDGVLIGSNVLITDHAHGSYSGEVQSNPLERPGTRPLSRDGSVSIGRNAWIGDGVAVLPGAQIGEGSIIGANSVVTGTVPPYCIAVGSPAVPIRRWDPVSGRWEPWRGVEQSGAQ